MITIYTDGASRGNPGEAGAGAVIYKDDQVVSEVRKYLGEQTNNWAEYEAVYLALCEAREKAYTETPIVVYLDSKLVAEQLSGNWKIKKDTLRVQHDKIRALLDAHFTDVVFTHVRREKNAYADALANEAIDTHA